MAGKRAAKRSTAAMVAGQRKRRKNVKALPQETQVPGLAAHEGSDNDVELDEDDYSIFEHYGQGAGFLSVLNSEQLSAEQIGKPLSAKPNSGPPGVAPGAACVPEGGDNDELDEETYEHVARSAPAESKGTPAVPLLPFKAADGSLFYSKAPSQARYLKVPGVSIVDVDGDADISPTAPSKEEAPAEEEAHGGDGGAPGAELGEGGSCDGDDKAHDEGAGPSKTRHPLHPPNSAVLSQWTQNIGDARPRIAVAASKLVEAPEGCVGQLRLLLEAARSKDAQVSKLALVSLLAVFKSIVPGYKIRAPSEKELEVKVSRAIQQMRDYEATLLKAFTAYVRLLRSISGTAEVSRSHRRIAVKCLCGILDALPHFNHIPDVLQSVVPLVASHDERVRKEACDSISLLLARGQQGDVMVEAVQLVADLVRRRKCKCHPDVVRALLALEAADLTLEDMERGSARLRAKVKRKKKQRREDAVSAALQEADARADADQARLSQSLMLEALFELLFRVVKQCTASGALRGAAALPPEELTRRFPLFAPALDGLAKYTHLISVEYCTDLLRVFEQLLDCAALPPAARFRCLLTAMAILRAQGDALLVDRQRLYQHLYAALATCPLAPLDLAGVDGPEGVDAERSDAAAVERAGTSPCDELAARCAHDMLSALRVGDFARLGAFVKRLCACAGHAEPGLAMGHLTVAARLVMRHLRLRGMLDSEQRGGPLGCGGYDPSAPDPGQAGALQCALWELAALCRHYHPHVALMARSIAGIPVDGGTPSWAGPVSTGQDPVEVTAAYAFARSGLFRPAPEHARRGKRRAHDVAGALSEQLAGAARDYAGAAVWALEVDGEEIPELLHMFSVNASEERNRLATAHFTTSGD